MKSSEEKHNFFEEGGQEVPQAGENYRAFLIVADLKVVTRVTVPILLGIHTIVQLINDISGVSQCLHALPLLSTLMTSMRFKALNVREFCFNFLYIDLVCVDFA